MLDPSDLDWGCTSYSVSSLRYESHFSWAFPVGGSELTNRVKVWDLLCQASLVRILKSSESRYISWAHSFVVTSTLTCFLLILELKKRTLGHTKKGSVWNKKKLRVCFMSITITTVNSDKRLAIFWRQQIEGDPPGWTGSQKTWGLEATNSNCQVIWTWFNKAPVWHKDAGISMASRISTNLLGFTKSWTGVIPVCMK